MIVGVADRIAGVRYACKKVPVPVGVMDLISPGIRNAGKCSVAVIAVADRSVPVRYGGYGAVRMFSSVHNQYGDFFRCINVEIYPIHWDMLF